MHLTVVGLNHKTASVELRERLCITEQQLPSALAVLSALPGVRECVILSTCNRTEIYTYAADHGIDECVTAGMGEICGVPAEEFTPALYVYRGHKAAEHLFRVASGIDSMVTGEQQILGQVKTAYATASAEGVTGGVLNNLFQQAITVGKKARTDTDIARGAFSVGSVAVQLARSIFEELAGRTALVVGAGKMAELTITHLTSSGVSSVLVANRTPEKAERLASQFNGRAVRFDDLSSALSGADIVITSTGASEPIITRETVHAAMRVRRGRPVFIIDIAVPRDVEEEVGTLDNVFVYDIDDLEGVLAAGGAIREAEVAKVEDLVAGQVEEFMRWFRTLDAVPTITALREKYESICDSEMQKLRSRLPELSDEQWNAVTLSARSIVRRICHEPLIRIRQYAESDDSSEKLEAARELLGLQEDSEESDTTDDKDA